MVPCPTCPGQKTSEAQRCGACYAQLQQDRWGGPKPHCLDCGKKIQKKATRCGPCFWKVNGASWICPDCGGRKGNGKSKRCAACYQLALARNADGANDVLLSFDARKFVALLERPDVEWPPRLLSARSGVCEKTIRSWLRGQVKPRRSAWEQVARVLALEVCQQCHGSGTVDPTEERIARITNEVRCQRPPVLRAVLPSSITHGASVLNPGLRQLLIGETVIHLSSQECRLLVHLATHSDRYSSAEELGEAIWQPGRSALPSAHAARICLSRLLTKLAAAGIERIIENRLGAGYRLEVSA